MRWWLTILKITSLLYTCQIYTLNVSLIVKTRRSVDSFVEPIYAKEISRKSISYLGSKIWNGLDRNIKTSNSFKHALKIQFEENYYHHYYHHYYFETVMVFLLFLLLLALFIHLYIHLFILIMYVYIHICTYVDVYIYIITWYAFYL